MKSDQSSLQHLRTAYSYPELKSEYELLTPASLPSKQLSGVYF